MRWFYHISSLYPLFLVLSPVPRYSPHIPQNSYIWCGLTNKHHWRGTSLLTQLDYWCFTPMTSQVLVGLCNYPLVNVYSLLLNMAIETVDFPMNAIFQFVMSDSSPKSNFHRRDVRLLYRKNVPCIPLVPSYIPTPYLLVYQTKLPIPHPFTIFSPYVPHIFAIYPTPKAAEIPALRPGTSPWLVSFWGSNKTAVERQWRGNARQAGYR